ncbi:glycosyltransferase family 2 protein [Desulfuromonas sp. AOP6]|uniref:glycosyltransferase family 2 protein n=1 Tax=Desulfuromonas sp. AOP6 TaxID=1566351 RepID=UPI00126B4452|nr:glycosyltransferase family 2 protein [Desulfuromonas sp. AOP6]BCA80095.1 glycosyl transferase [Desulfuromonas sp. AOP6]
MKISIAMATYNGAQYIQEQLQSFVDQTRQPDEVIITDDCSTDETETIVREFAKTSPFTVEFHRNEQNLGYCGNFNTALMKTTGDLVFLSDQDDVWFPEKIEHMLGVAERNPEALLVMNDAALTDGALNEVGLTKVGQIRTAGFSMDSFVMGCCCGIRRELLELCMPIPTGFKGHDSWLVWFADGLNARMVDSTVLQYYRRHEANESQFIANRTTKVTKAHAFFHSLHKQFCKEAANLVRTQVDQLKIFVSAVETAEKNAPEKYRNRLTELKIRTKQKILTIENRMRARGKWLFPRVIAVGSLLAKGGYRNTSGFKAVLRDIVG